MKLNRSFIQALGVLAVSVLITLSAKANETPNIVYILADDMGNIDRIGREGIHFTDAHSGSAVCTPTRYGILTGRYSWRTHLKRGVLYGYGRHLIPTTTLWRITSSHAAGPTSKSPPSAASMRTSPVHNGKRDRTHLNIEEPSCYPAICILDHSLTFVWSYDRIRPQFNRNILPGPEIIHPLHQKTTRNMGAIHAED
jgi:hypothetical protein